MSGMFNAQLEANVIRCILTRENYLDKLARILLEGNVLSDETLSALNHIRNSTVTTIEAINEWKTVQKKENDPFMWNDLNYILTIPSDLDFLSNIKPLVKLLGFDLIRNPFVLPSNLDKSTSEPDPKNDNTYIDGITIGRIKECERTIKAEEEKYGVISRDREGNFILEIPDKVPPKKKNQLNPKILKSSSMPTLPYSQKQQQFENSLEPTIEEDDGNISPIETPNKPRAQSALTTPKYQSLEPLEMQPANNDSENDQPKSETPKFSLYNIKTKKSTTNRKRPESAKTLEQRQKQKEYEAEKDKNRQLKIELEAIKRDIRLKEREYRRVKQQMKEVDDLRCDGKISILRQKLEEFYLLEQQQTQADVIIEKANNGEEGEGEEGSNPNNNEEENEKEKRDKQFETFKEDEKKDRLYYLNDPNLTEIQRQEQAAVHIQSLIRGGIGRKAFHIKKKQYNYNATVIECGIRKHLAKKTVKERRIYLKKIIIMESVIRGFLARRRVKHIRYEILRNKSAIKIQKTFRGEIGKNRMKLRRQMIQLSLQCFNIINNLSLVHINTICNLDQPPSIVYTICRLLCILLCKDLSNINYGILSWNEIKTLLQPTVLFPILKELTKMTKRGEYRMNEDKRYLIGIFLQDITITKSDFNSLPSAYSSILYQLCQYIHYLYEIHSYCEIFENDENKIEEFTKICEENCTFEKPHDININTNNDSTTTTSVSSPSKSYSFYINPELVNNPEPENHKHYIILFNKYIPTIQRHDLIVEYLNYFPIHSIALNINDINNEICKELLYYGYDLLLECDAGISNYSHKSFNEFLTGDLLKDIIVTSNNNSSNNNNVESTSSVDSFKSPLIIRQQQTQQQKESENNNNDNNNQPKIIMFTANYNNRIFQEKTQYGIYPQESQSLLDYDIKILLEKSVQEYYQLNDPNILMELKSISSSGKCPNVFIPHILEALNIILNKDNDEDFPSRNPNSEDRDKESELSWDINRSLLFNPNKLLQRMKNNNPYEIKYKSYLILKAYLNHIYWPKTEWINEQKESLKHLIMWIQYRIEFLKKLYEKGGPVPYLSTEMSIYNQIIEVYDGDMNGFEDNTISNNAGTGWRNAFVLLLKQVLNDYKLFKDGKKIDDIYFINEIYGLNDKLYIVIYESIGTSMKYISVNLEQINYLLKPLTLDKYSIKEPPTTREDLYNRLLNLLVLQPIIYNNNSDNYSTNTTQTSVISSRTNSSLANQIVPLTSTNQISTNKHLFIERKACELKKKTMRIGNNKIFIVTVYQIPEGGLLFNLLCTNNNKEQKLVIPSEMITIIKENASESERKQLVSSNPDVFLEPLFDRLECIDEESGEITMKKKMIDSKIIKKEGIKIGEYTGDISIYEDFTEQQMTVVIIKFKDVDINEEIILELNENEFIEIFTNTFDNCDSSIINKILKRISVHYDEANKCHYLVIDHNIFKGTVKISGYSLNVNINVIDNNNDINGSENNNGIIIYISSPNCSEKEYIELNENYLSALFFNVVEWPPLNSNMRIVAINHLISLLTVESVDGTNGINVEGNIMRIIFNKEINGLLCDSNGKIIKSGNYNNSIKSLLNEYETENNNIIVNDNNEINNKDENINELGDLDNDYQYCEWNEIYKKGIQYGNGKYHCISTIYENNNEKIKIQIYCQEYSCQPQVILSRLEIQDLIGKRQYLMDNEKKRDRAEYIINEKIDLEEFEENNNNNNFYGKSLPHNGFYIKLFPSHIYITLSTTESSSTVTTPKVIERESQLLDNNINFNEYNYIEVINNDEVDSDGVSIMKEPNEVESKEFEDSEKVIVVTNNIIDSVQQEEPPVEERTTPKSTTQEEQHSNEEINNENIENNNNDINNENENNIEDNDGEIVETTTPLTTEQEQVQVNENVIDNEEEEEAKITDDLLNNITNNNDGSIGLDSEPEDSIEAPIYSEDFDYKGDDYMLSVFQDNPDIISLRFQAYFHDSQSSCELYLSNEDIINIIKDDNSVDDNDVESIINYLITRIKIRKVDNYEMLYYIGVNPYNNFPPSRSSVSTTNSNGNNVVVGVTGIRRISSTNIPSVEDNNNVIINDESLNIQIYEGIEVINDISYQITVYEKQINNNQSQNTIIKLCDLENGFEGYYCHKNSIFSDLQFKPDILQDLLLKLKIEYISTLKGQNLYIYNEEDNERYDQITNEHIMNINKGDYIYSIYYSNLHGIFISCKLLQKNNNEGKVNKELNSTFNIPISQLPYLFGPFYEMYCDNLHIELTIMLILSCLKTKDINLVVNNRNNLMMTLNIEKWRRNTSLLNALYLPESNIEKSFKIILNESGLVDCEGKEYDVIIIDSNIISFKRILVLNSDNEKSNIIMINDVNKDEIEMNDDETELSDENLLKKIEINEDGIVYLNL